jgi:hypothetical protein
MRNFNSQEGVFKPILRIKITPEELSILDSGHKKVQSRVKDLIDLFSSRKVSYQIVLVKAPLLYTTYLKNWFLTASAFSQNSHLHSRLVHAQWSLVPDQNFEKPSCQIPNFSNTLCIVCGQSLKVLNIMRCIFIY